MIDLKPGDFALIDWNGSIYNKKQHYHIVELRNNDIIVRVPGSKIKIIIQKKDIKHYEIKSI